MIISGGVQLPIRNSVVMQHLKCMDRIATALERQAGIESPAPPNIRGPR